MLYHNRFHFLRFLLPAAGLLLLGACQRHTPITPGNSLDRKSAPYDHFTFRRSYPDTTFDWNAWRKVLSATKQRAALAQERNASPCDPVPVSTTPWTLQGPSNFAGRVNTIAVKPDDENTVLVGFAGGGIFKTTDAGVTWTPVFDQNAELAIGAITFDPSQPNVVYAGTGDVNMPSILYNGDGVYKSTDAGNTWTYLGLNQAGIISEIIVHPTNPQIIWVSSMGNPYVRTPERGVYKTVNGGQTWTKVLHISNQAGCSSLVTSAANPQVLYASFWDRLRSNSESFVWGPNAKVYKSADGGDTWTHLTGGLPMNNNGRTGLAVSQQNPDKAYVVYIDTLSTTGSLYKTVDGGLSWTPVNVNALEDACADFGWYFGKITLNPNNDEDLFFHGILLYRRLSNGSWTPAAGGHADSHDLKFCPSGRRYWSNDGGLYRNEPNQQAWIKSRNLPATQVYRTAYNHLKPNEFWLGSQDNGIKRGSAANINNWSDVLAGDGFESAFHPTSTDTFWVEAQWGNLGRTGNNGVNWTFTGPAFGQPNERVNWDAPIFRSVHPPHRFYAATFRVLASANGSGFGAASNDLTDGVVIGPGFHNISCIGESPIQEGRLYAGTSDANVWTRTPNGTWTNITAGLPTRYVTSVTGSPLQVQRIFVTHSGFRDDDYVPHIHRSDNNGQTWIDISGDLPPVPVNQLFVVPGQGDSILAAATDAGVYATRNGGVNWFRLGMGMPAVPVLDFAHNLVRKELVAATYGRGIWTFPIDSIKTNGTSAPNITTLTLSGAVKNALQAPVAQVSFPDLNPNAVSDSNGQYDIDEVPGCSTVTVRPYRNDDPVNGVNAWDLILISRHILNLEPITLPYNLIAGDANRSGTVTSFDIVLLRKLILGADTAFLNNTSWRFIPASFQFNTPDNPFVDSFPEHLSVALEQQPVTLGDFVAIKTGDIDNTHLPSVQGSADDRQYPVWPLWIKPAEAEAGKTIALPIKADRSIANACQFTIRFDPTLLEWQMPEIVAEGLDPNWHFFMEKAGEGWVSFVFDPETEAPEGWSGLFTLQFKVLQNCDVTRVVQITSDKTTALAFRNNGAPLRPILYWDRPVEDGLEIFPNPSFNRGCWVRSAHNGVVTVWDHLGRQVSAQNIQKDEPVWIQTPQSGMYRVQLQAGSQQWSKAVVVH